VTSFRKPALPLFVIPETRKRYPESMLEHCSFGYSPISPSYRLLPARWHGSRIKSGTTSLCEEYAPLRPPQKERDGPKTAPSRPQPDVQVDLKAYYSLTRIASSRIDSTTSMPSTVISADVSPSLASTSTNASAPVLSI
jgi:hypothetical protein